MKSLRNLLLCSSFLMTVAFPLHAQTHAEQVGDQENSLDEIVVTARRIAENLQEAPVAITALNAELIEERGATNPDDILNYVPGVAFDRVNPLEQTISIRGIASGSEGTSSDAGVVFMIDDEVISRDFMRSAAFFDVAQVEVLRGPQGTAFGRNATAGVVHLRTQRPKFEQSADFRLDLGDYGLIEGAGAVNRMLSDNLAMRLSAFRSERDGYTEDAVTGEDIDFAETSAIRGQLLFETDGGTSFLLRGHYSDESFGPTPRKSADPSQPFESPFTSYIELSEDPYRVQNSDVSGFSREIYGASLEIVSDLGPVTLTSLSTYRNGEATFSQDFYGTPDDLTIGQGFDSSEAFTQELRVDNSRQGDRLTYVAGAFLLREKTSRFEDRDIFVLPELPFLETDQVFGEENKTTSIGSFLELRYELSDRTIVSLGGRYSHDKKSYEVTHDASGALADFFIDTDLAPIAAKAKKNFSALTFRASIDQKIGDDSFAYIKVGNGFKSGGFNSEPFNFEAATTPFDMETVLSYEAGLKSELFDNTLRLNSAVFYNQFDDIQEEFFLPSGAATIANVASASTTGFETEWFWAPSNFFDFDGSFAYFDHSYNDFIDAEGNDLSGNKIANVPDWTLRLGGALKLPLAEKGDLKFRIDYRTRDDILEEANNDPSAVRPGVGILDARLTWRSQSERLSVSVWGRNLTDQAEVLVAGFKGIFSQRPRSYGEPRTIGASLSMKLGG